MNKNNYLVINGKRVDLTEEQIEKLGLEIKKKSPFDRAEEFWYIYPSGTLGWYTDLGSKMCDEYFNSANYCTDKALLTARAKEEVLSRLLWRFSMENGGDEIDLENTNQAKYKIYYDSRSRQYSIDFDYTWVRQGAISFISEKVAQRAIDEIVIPFYAGELEVCKIWE